MNLHNRNRKLQIKMILKLYFDQTQSEEYIYFNNKIFILYF